MTEGGAASVAMKANFLAMATLLHTQGRRRRVSVAAASCALLGKEGRLCYSGVDKEADEPCA